MPVRRLIVYLLLNAVVAIAATWLALWVWENYISPRSALPRTTAFVAPSPTPAPGFPAVIASPLPTLPPTAPAGPVTHIVQSGDTLGSIAQRYGRSIEELMQANALSDPNRLDVGQTLIVSGPPPTALPTDAPPVAPLATATPNPNAPAPNLSIREVKSPGVLAEEVVVIANTGGPVNLAGWTLRDETGRAYTFPALTLFEGGIVNVHTRAGQDSVIDLYWNLAAPVWRAGGLLLLTDPNGNLSARYTVP